eukprot:6183804-Pleurochrysis_carterae.AAC.2
MSLQHGRLRLARHRGCVCSGTVFAGGCCGIEIEPNVLDRGISTLALAGFGVSSTPDPAR